MSLKIIRAYGVSMIYVKKASLLRNARFELFWFSLSMSLSLLFRNPMTLSKGKNILRVFSHSYNRHCINKRLDECDLEQDQTTDLRLIFLENKLNKVRKIIIFRIKIRLFSSLSFNVIQKKFEEKMKKNINEKNLNINYAIADTDKHYEIVSLLSKYQSLKNLVINK